MFDGSGRDGRATEIGVKNHPGGIDNLLQRVAERATQFALDRICNAFNRELRSSAIESAAADLGTQAAQDCANRITSGGTAFATYRFADSRRAKDVVRRRDLPQELRFLCRHSRISPDAYQSHKPLRSPSRAVPDGGGSS